MDSSLIQLPRHSVEVEGRTVTFGPVEKLVLLYIAHLSKESMKRLDTEEDIVAVSFKQLKRFLGCGSYMTAVRAVADLVTLGYLTKISASNRDGGNAANFYRVRWDVINLRVKE